MRETEYVHAIHQHRHTARADGLEKADSRGMTVDPLRSVRLATEERGLLKVRVALAHD